MRFPTEGSAAVSTNKARGISSILTDVSAGGANLVTNVPFELTEKVEVLIRASILFKEAFKKQARVAWCRRFGADLWQVGLDFGVDKLLNLS